MSQPQLTETGRLALWPNGGGVAYIDHFRLRCGSEYAAGVTTGGEYNAVIEIVTESDEQRLAVSSEISAGGSF